MATGLINVQNRAPNDHMNTTPSLVRRRSESSYCYYTEIAQKIYEAVLPLFVSFVLYFFRRYLEVASPWIEKNTFVQIIKLRWFWTMPLIIYGCIKLTGMYFSSINRQRQGSPIESTSTSTIPSRQSHSALSQVNNQVNQLHLTILPQHPQQSIVKTPPQIVSDSSSSELPLPEPRRRQFGEIHQTNLIPPPYYMSNYNYQLTNVAIRTPKPPSPLNEHDLRDTINPIMPLNYGGLNQSSDQSDALSSSTGMSISNSSDSEIMGVVVVSKNNIDE